MSARKEPRQVRPLLQAAMKSKQMMVSFLPNKDSLVWYGEAVCAVLVCALQKKGGGGGAAMMPLRRMASDPAACEATAQLRRGNMIIWARNRRLLLCDRESGLKMMD